MTEHVAHPLRRFSPGVSILLPEGWAARASLELVSAEQRTIVSVTIDEAGPLTELEEYAAAYGKLLAEQLAGYGELNLGRRPLRDGRPALVRRFVWAPEGGSGPIEQVQLYLVENKRGLVATALAQEAGLDEIESRLREVVSGVRLDGSAPTVGLARAGDDPRSRTYAAFERGELTTSLERALGGTVGGRADPDVWRTARESWEQAAGS
jgi:hypothetical protein